MAEPDDATITGWALAARAGDRAAAGSLIRATAPQIHRFLTHLVPAGEAEDLTQETYLRVMRALPRFAGRSSARTWLYAIARRVAADHFRRTATRPQTVDLAGWQATAAVRAAGELDEQLALRDLLDRLTPERRLAFVATQVVGLSYEEAAEVCGCPAGTIRSRVARARDDLIRAVRDQPATGHRRRGTGDRDHGNSSAA